VCDGQFDAELGRSDVDGRDYGELKRVTHPSRAYGPQSHTADRLRSNLLDTIRCGRGRGALWHSRNRELTTLRRRRPGRRWSGSRE
jgi:hypothetical protein